MKYIKKINILLLLILITGCLADDYKDCDRLYLHFSYLADGTTEVFDRYIEKVDIYVFDSEQRHVLGPITIEADQLRKERGIDIPIQSPGNYEIVCVGNAHPNTQIELNGESTRAGNAFERMYFGGISSYPTGILEGGIDSLYHSSVKVNIPENKYYRYVEETASFNSSHYKVSVEVFDMPPAENPSETPKAMGIISLGNLPPYLTFLNTPCDVTVSYRPKAEYTPQESKLCTNIFNIARHNRDSQACVDVLYEDGDALCSFNLEDIVKKHNEQYPNDPDKRIDLNMQEVYIPIQIILERPIIVKVADWYIKDIKPGFH